MPRSPKRSSLQTTYGSPAARATVGDSGTAQKESWMSSGRTGPQHSETTIPWIQVAPPSNEFPDRAASTPDPVSRQATWISPSPTAVAAGDWITRPGVVSETWTFADQEAPSVLDREW